MPGEPKPAPTRPAWPRETPAALTAFYGPFRLRADGLPTAAREARNLTTITPPYPLRVAWDPKVAITPIRCHRLVAESLQNILRAILDHYGSAALVRAAPGSRLAR